MRTQKSADLVSGCLVAVLGVVVLIAASQIKGGMEERLPPRTLPYAVGAMIVAGGLSLALKARRLQGPDTAIKWPDRAGAVRVTTVSLSLAAYIALIEPLGMPVATALFVASLIWYLDRKRIVAAVITGLLSAAVVYYLFMQFLGLTLPLGPLAQ